MSYDRAYDIAAEAFLNIKDKAGQSYINHLMRVVVDYTNHLPIRENYFVTQDEYRCIAILHDLVEDTDWTLDDLRKEGFSEVVITGIDALTRRKGENYDQYVDRIVKTPYIIPIKLADLKHNMDLTRLPEIGPKDVQRVIKYHKYFKKLQQNEIYD